MTEINTAPAAIEAAYGTVNTASTALITRPCIDTSVRRWISVTNATLKNETAIPTATAEIITTGSTAHASIPTPRAIATSAQVIVENSPILRIVAPTTTPPITAPTPCAVDKIPRNSGGRCRPWSI